MNDLLKPCPFCGERAYIAHSHDEDMCEWSFVKCSFCGARSQGKWTSEETCPVFYAEVREEWNRRAT